MTGSEWDGEEGGNFDEAFADKIMFLIISVLNVWLAPKHPFSAYLMVRVKDILGFMLYNILIHSIIS